MMIIMIPKNDTDTKKFHVDVAVLDHIDDYDYESMITAITQANTEGLHTASAV